MENNSASSPEMKSSHHFSLVWLIPLITSVLGIWLVASTILEQGPDITLTFKSADGIEAGKTRIKYKNVDIGVVETVEFNKTSTHVVLTINMVKSAQDFLKDSAKFWVVRPQLSIKGVSGLGTLVSGSYIEIEPGTGADKRNFVGLEIPPVVRADVAGKKIILNTNHLGSLSTGSPIYYQGIPVGEVLGYELEDDNKNILIHCFINEPYNNLINNNSRFWNISGLDVSLDANGISLHSTSVQSLLLGGIAFESPLSLRSSLSASNDQSFRLYDNYSDALDTKFTHKDNFILFFDKSVRGLDIGAPIEFKGINIGSVTDIQLNFNKQDSSFLIAVLIEIESDKFIPQSIIPTQSSNEIISQLIKSGLRAQLNNGNLITGKLFVQLDMYPGSKLTLIDSHPDFVQIPTIPGGLQEITQAAKSILAKLNDLPLNDIGKELLGTLEGSNKLLNSNDLKGSVAEVKTSLESFQSTLKLLDGILKEESPMQKNLNEMVSEVSKAAASLDSLLKLLEEDPQSIIFGRDDE